MKPIFCLFDFSGGCPNPDSDRAPDRDSDPTTGTHSKAHIQPDCNGDRYSYDHADSHTIALTDRNHDRRRARPDIL